MATGNLAVPPADAPAECIGEHVVHPAAAMFPLLQGAEYRDLVKSIKAEGLLEPIELLDDQVIDGRNRYRACVELRIEPEFTVLPADTDPWAYAMAKNMARRHLTPGQRAAIWLEYDRQIREHAAAARTRGNAKRAEAVARRLRNSLGAFESGAALPPTGHANDPTAAPAAAKTREVLAKRAGVSPRTAQKALTLQQQAPELHRAVVAGEVTLEKALRRARNSGRDMPAADMAAADRERFHATSMRQLDPLRMFFERDPKRMARWRRGRWVDPCAGDGAMPRLLAELNLEPHTWTLFELRAAEAEGLLESGHEVHCPSDFLSYDGPAGVRARPDIRDQDVSLVITNLPWPEPGIRIVAHVFAVYPRADVLALCELDYLHRDWTARGEPRQAWIAEHQPDYLILPGRGHEARALAFEGESTYYPKSCAWLHWPAKERNRRRGAIEVLG